MGNKLWFKRKKYGWGWAPANLAGWIVIVLYVLCIGIYPVLTKLGYFPFSVGIYLLLATLFTIVLFWVCFKKGEKPSWQWGK